MIKVKNDLLFQRQATISADNVVLYRLIAKAMLKRLSERTFALTLDVSKQ